MLTYMHIIWHGLTIWHALCGRKDALYQLALQDFIHKIKRTRPAEAATVYVSCGGQEETGHSFEEVHKVEKWYQLTDAAKVI